MLFKKSAGAHFIVACSALILASAAVAADADDQPAPVLASNTNSATGRYGLFDALDHRSAYTQEVFPSGFFWWMIWAWKIMSWSLPGCIPTQARRGQTSDRPIPGKRGLADFGSGGALRANCFPGRSINGIGNIQLGARYPLYQAVSANQMIDATFGLAMEGEIPTIPR